MKPASITIRDGDNVAVRYGRGTLLELGSVVNLRLGIPRTIEIKLENGERVWLLIETPVASEDGP